MTAVRIDGRRTRALAAELERRAVAVLSGDGSDRPVGAVARSLLGVAARIGEEVTRRLDEAPAKQSANFYAAAGLGRDPAQPALVPVAFRLAETVTAGIAAPERTRLISEAGPPVVFETIRRIDIVPGAINALRGLDAATDSVFQPSSTVASARLPRATIVHRRLSAGAAAGAVKLQIDPAAGLAKAMLLRIGEGDDAREHEVTAVEDDLVTIDPPLERTLAEGAPASEVDSFAPFGTGSRDHQRHSLYLGHATMLDVPSEVSIVVSGTQLPADTAWSWWGKTDEDLPADWQPLAAEGPGPTLSLRKEKGKPAKKSIHGRETLWLRAQLPGKSAGAVVARDIRLAIGGEGVCSNLHEKRCDPDEDKPPMAVAFEAIANTTPVVPNSAFHPFGREPRLYDSFYIGSAEAFSKADADISLCFEFGGADFRTIAEVSDGKRVQVFGVGSDRLLYRAEFGDGAPRLEPVPLAEGVQLGKQAPIAARLAAGRVFVAMGGRNGIDVAELAFTGKLEPGSVTWTKHPTNDEDVGDAVASAILLLAGTPIFFVLFSKEQENLAPVTTLAKWEKGSDGYKPTVTRGGFTNLIPVQGTGSLLIVRDQPSSQTVSRLSPDGTKMDVALPEDDRIPTRSLSAWAVSDTSTLFHVAGYSDPTSLSFFAITKDGRASTGGPYSVSAAHPPALVGSDVDPSRPNAVVATPAAVWFLWNGDDYDRFEDPYAIGYSDNEERRFLFAAGWAVVQRDDLGLWYRKTNNARPLVHATLDVVRRIAAVGPEAPPMNSVYAVAGAWINSKNQPAYSFAPATGVRMLQPVNPGAAAIPNADEALFYRVNAQSVGTVRTNPNNLVLEKDIAGTGPAPRVEWPPSPIFAFMEPPAGLPPETGIWRLYRHGTGASGDEWKLPADWPSTTPAARFKQLDPYPDIELMDASELVPGQADALQASILRGSVYPAWPALSSSAPASRIAALHNAGGRDFLILPRGMVKNAKIGVVVGPAAWSQLGPNRPANPGLSWEYWNGQSWWALQTEAAGPRDFADATANFQKNGGVFFTVPADLAPTDVGGRKNHWIRARLIGGDYGEAKVTVVSTTRVDGAVEQVATRDLSTIRAPYVISLKLGYCAQQRVPPEVVLTEDNLGAIDRTSANVAGLPVPVFTSLAELMNPPDRAEAAARAAHTGCDDPCPEPVPETIDPCAAPGAYESCDSPCEPPPQRSRVAAEASKAFVRGLMIGFDRPISGDTVSLYVDAAPAGPPVELTAEIWRGGRFEPVAVVYDASHGLTESGIVSLALPRAPDAGDLLGREAHWLRIHPKSGASSWSPRIRGLHLNAVLAQSTETRLMEMLGSSSGAQDQSFRLSEAPVADRSLELRVRESPGEEEAAEQKLDIADTLPVPGRWVLWDEVEDLEAVDGPERVYAFDPNEGVIRFGDGKAGMIPPLGADLIARSYVRVAGRSGNAIAAGKELQTLSPLAGVDKVIAVDQAAGGADVEAPEQARRRAPAKMRHGRRIVTLADIEEHALTLVPGIAQVRAEPRRGGAIRLVVAMAGAEPRPAPAKLRQFAAAIREVAAYGIARPGGLEAVAPRLLPLSVELILRPLTWDRFGAGAEQAKSELIRLFDPAFGNHDGRGWPVGRLPDEQDVAAALDRIGALALPESIRLRRADKETEAERRLPETIPSDVLVRLDAADIAVERAREEAA